MNTINGFNNYITYQYSNAGNVSQMAYYYAAQPGAPALLGSSAEYEFDEKPACWPSYTGFKLNAYTLSKNNITKVTVKDADGNVNLPESLLHSYAFNTQGCATQMTVSPISDISETRTVRFQYQCL